MAHSADRGGTAEQARRVYAEQLVKGLPAMVNSLAAAASQLLDKPCEHARFMRRRELVLELKQGAAHWHRSMVGSLRNALLQGVSVQRASDLPPPGSGRGALSLVDEDTIEREILTSRLALAMMDQAASEFTDLRARMASLERREELDAQDMLRAHVLARIVVDAWLGSITRAPVVRTSSMMVSSATVSATLSASTWEISIGVLHCFCTFSQDASRREARWIFLNTSRFIAHFWAVTEPAAPAPMTQPVMVCVVDTGMPSHEAANTMIEPPAEAEKP